MKPLILRLLFLCFTTASLPVAGQLPGNDLLVGCKALVAQTEAILAGKKPTFGSAYEEWLAAFCSGLIEGQIGQSTVLESLQLVRDETWLLCIPEGTEISQLARVVIAYLEGNPAVLHTPGGTLAFVGLRSEYKCGKN